MPGTMLKTGAHHVASLRDGRAVYINRAEAGDVTVHPSFRRTAQSVARMYDFQSRPENVELMTFDVGNGDRANRTRLLRFAPGVHTTRPFVHDYWEEVYLVSGDLIVGNDAEGQGGERFAPHTYACRPPGAYHGPFKSEGGCVLLEIHYYDQEG